jgi:hypothetical protein
MRRRRTVLITLTLLVGTVATVLGSVGYAVKREPDFYSRLPCPVDWDTREKAANLVTRVQDLKNDVRSKLEWGDTFTADDLNCFFVEGMGRKGALASMLPERFHSPRVAIDGDRLKLGFRYGEGFWSTVISLELRVWLVANETNLVAVEVCDLRAGGLPFGSQSILDWIAEVARDSHVEVTWYRHKGNPVGLFRFYADQPRPVSQILTLEVKDGTFTVAGRSFLDQPTATTALVPPLLKGPGTE